MAFLIRTNSVEYDGKGFGKGTLEYNIYGADSLTFTRAGNGSSIDKPPVKYSDVINPATGAAFVSLAAFTAYLDANFFKLATTSTGTVGGVTYAGAFTPVVSVATNYPTTGTGTGGAVKKGDLYRIAADGIMHWQYTGFTIDLSVKAGDFLIALQDAPAQAAHWAILHTTVTPEQLDAKQNASEKNQANGYAGLDGTGKVAAAQLPATGPSNTDGLSEGATNKYFTEPRVLATKLTGLTTGDTSTDLTATDTQLTGWGKVKALLNNFFNLVRTTKLVGLVNFLPIRAIQSDDTFAECFSRLQNQATDLYAKIGTPLQAPPGFDGTPTITGPIRLDANTNNSTQLSFDTGSGGGDTIFLKAFYRNLSFYSSDDTGNALFNLRPDGVNFDRFTPNIQRFTALSTYAATLGSYGIVRKDYLLDQLKTVGVTLNTVPSAVKTAVAAAGHTWTKGDLVTYGTTAQQTTATASTVLQGMFFDKTDTAAVQYRYTYCQTENGIVWTRMPKPTP